ncbi:MAG: BBP7 family outer membrane beta-barrel protein [Gemmataceae bacterium]
MNTSRTRSLLQLCWLLAFILLSGNLATAQSLHEQRSTDHNYVGTETETPPTQVVRPTKTQQPVVQASLGFSEAVEVLSEHSVPPTQVVMSHRPSVSLPNALASPTISARTHPPRHPVPVRSRGSIPTLVALDDQTWSPPSPSQDQANPKQSLPTVEPDTETQEPKPITQPAVIGEPVLESYVTPVFTGLNTYGPYKYWLDLEGLVWWLQDAPIPPLVTVDFGDRDPEGALTNPGTRVVLGDEIDDGPFYGFQGRFGAWLDHRQVLGLEASAFVLFEQSRTYRIESGPDGNPPLSFPIFAANLGQEGSFPISDPNTPGNPIFIPPEDGEGPPTFIPTSGPLVGAVDITHTSELWGAELLARCKLVAKPHFKLHFLTGFRYLELDEELTIDYAGRNVPLAQNIAFRDLFDTENQFYGVNLGAHMVIRHKKLQLDLLGKVALGTTTQSTNIHGNTTISGTGAANPGIFVGGLFSQPTNIGVRNESDFTVVPEAQVKLSVQVLPRMKLFAGYSFLYWGSVVRPGDQIDRSVNLTQAQGGPIIGGARPTSNFHRSGLWAHGINFGALVTY